MCFEVDFDYLNIFYPPPSQDTMDMPALSDFLLTAADILNLKLAAKLVVVSSCHTRDEQHGGNKLMN